MAVAAGRTPAGVMDPPGFEHTWWIRDRGAITTDTETLHYTVTQSRTVPRQEFPTDIDIWNVHPGRLVWISCHLENGEYSDHNFVVIADL